MWEFNWISVGGHRRKERAKCIKVESVWRGLSPFELRIHFYHCAQGYNQLGNTLITLVEKKKKNRAA